MFPWAIFLGLIIIIGLTGYQLSYNAKIISQKTGLGETWIGLFLLSLVTSLPELITGISSVRFSGVPDFAIGDILGSCVLNLMLVFILDVVYRESSIYKKTTQSHLLTGIFGVILMSFIGFGLLASQNFLVLKIGHVDIYTLSIPIFYILSMITIHNFEKKENRINETPFTEKHIRSTSIAVVVFALAAVVVISAASILPKVGISIGKTTGWNTSFIGTLFFSIATSTPEIVVTLSAVKLKMPAMAFSNLLGSNLFNGIILTIDDLFYSKGPLFESVQPVHAITAFSSAMMTGLVLLALLTKPERKIMHTVNSISLVLLVVYIINSYIIYKMG
tara:strand:- start:2126 stop:3124 length:999 start_codon:yes stop_codon:yes gene_type:complete